MTTADPTPLEQAAADLLRAAARYPIIPPAWIRGTAQEEGVSVEELEAEIERQLTTPPKGED